MVKLEHEKRLTLKTNQVSEPLAAAWLADAQKRLDDIG